MRRCPELTGSTELKIGLRQADDIDVVLTAVFGVEWANERES
jgi:hypothetical protein